MMTREENLTWFQTKMATASAEEYKVLILTILLMSISTMSDEDLDSAITVLKNTPGVTP